MKDFHLKIIFRIQKELKNGMKILDAGCGTGMLMRSLQPFGDVEGLELSSEARLWCHRAGFDNICSDDLNVWTPSENTFHLITCIDVLYHQNIASDSGVLKKFNQALKPDGTLLLHLPAFPILTREHDVLVETSRRYRIDPLATR